MSKANSIFLVICILISFSFQIAIKKNRMETISESTEQSTQPKGFRPPEDAATNTASTNAGFTAQKEETPTTPQQQTAAAPEPTPAPTPAPTTAEPAPAEDKSIPATTEQKTVEPKAEPKPAEPEPVQIATQESKRTDVQVTTTSAAPTANNSSSLLKTSFAVLAITFALLF
jgi:hypothetical protein